MSDSLKDQIKQSTITAMKAKDKERLGTLRMLSAAIKQREVDERIELNDTDVLTVINKMIKQRRDSIKQFTDGGRQDLADVEIAELAILEEYLPEQLDEAAIADAVKAAISESGAESIKDMGKVMGILKPKLTGQADMGLVSKLVKEQLAS